MGEGRKETERGDNWEWQGQRGGGINGEEKGRKGGEREGTRKGRGRKESYGRENDTPCTPLIYGRNYLLLRRFTFTSK